MKKTLIISFMFLSACGKAINTTERSPASDNGILSSEGGDQSSSGTGQPLDEVGGMTPISPPRNSDAPISSKILMEIDKTQINLAHGPGVTWVGCSTKAVMRGGYNDDSTCGRALVHPQFATAMVKSFYGCIAEAASSSGINPPAKVFINHFGSYNDRNARGSSRLSNHAFAAALDINNFLLYDVKGNLTKISTHVRNYSGVTAKFYDSFRACWKSTMPSRCTRGSSEGDGSIGHTKSRLGGNTLHNDHIHLTLPECAR